MNTAANVLSHLIEPKEEVIKVRCGNMQERRHFDLFLWQSLLSGSSTCLALSCSIWNYLSTPHFAMRPIENLQDGFSIVKGC
jgi:hypothetical protein